MESFVNLHKNQLESSNVPEFYWPTLFNKLTNEILDVGEYFMMAQVIEEDEDVNEVDDISWKIIVNVGELSTADPNSIFLIDHAWTYIADEARQQLKNDSKLLARMANLMGVCTENCQNDDGDDGDIVEKVFSEMWRFNQTYSIGNNNLGSESANPIWYVMDEFGSRVQHSDTPSVKMVPFCYVPTKTAFTIMWPIQDLKMGDEVTRDYVNMPNVSSKLRKFLLFPWIRLDDDDDEEDGDDDDDDDEIFNSKFSVHTSLPTIRDHYQDLSDLQRKLKVFSDVEQVCDHLKHPAFSLVDSWEEADVIWTKRYLSDFKSFSEETPNKLINQFPFEMVLTIKNMLFRVCKNYPLSPDSQKIDLKVDLADLTKSPNPDHLEFPNWLAVTFDLKNELDKFVRYFRRREKSALCNCWILKPYNLSRGLDTHITGNVNQIIRLVETGPKVACLYIDDPVLLRREDVGGLVKFDLRFIVMLVCLQPLRLAVHKKFLIRVANREFSMRNFDEYEQHFTVMNYKPGAKMHIIACEEMEQRFENQYPSFRWNDVLSDIYGVISEMFKRASRLAPPKGIGHCPQSRTIYGVDVMLKWNKQDSRPASIQPVILECNFGPDNTRFLRSYPTFFDDVFETLFLNSQFNPKITYITC